MKNLISWYIFFEIISRKNIWYFSGTLWALVREAGI
jgi:hypothetical protein